MARQHRILFSIPGGVGHAFPAFALARALRERGHDVMIETYERWRGVVEGMDIRFRPGLEKVLFPGPPGPGDDAVGMAQAVLRTVPLFREFEPEVVVHDLFGIAPAIAAELDGVRTATLIQHVWPEYGPKAPPWAWGFGHRRTPVGAAAWRAASAVKLIQRRLGKRALDDVRAQLGMGPSSGGPMLSEELVLVATFPQLEYPLPRPPRAHVTGPMLFELPYEDVKLPPGDEPLVLVAASTGLDLERGLLGYALEALADEPVRVLATINERGAEWPGEVPANARVYDWISYAGVLPSAAAVVTRGGHGTIARSLSDGVPVLAIPAGGDQPENAARLSWSGAGLMLPRRFLAPGPLGLAVRRLLGDGRFSSRAKAIAAWGADHDGAVRGAELIERQLQA